MDIHLQDLEQKYRNLVWYARKPPTEDEASWAEYSPGIRKAALISVFEVEKNYPEECAALSDPDTGDWTHGFNSGMLAALRYVLTLCEKGRAQADIEFPVLDT